MKLLPASLAVLAVLALVGGLMSTSAQARRTYIVQLAAEPAASYTGNLAGYAATQPVAGARFNARSAAVRSYKGFLDSQQSSVASLVRGAPVVAHYATVYNGFAARLTDAEVATLRASPLVVDVQVDEARKMDTVSTSAFLGLSAPGGVWSQSVGGLAVKGEDIIIGIVDSGIWPESLSYADRVDDTGKPVSSGGALAYGAPPAGWTGSCAAGEGFTPALHCNNKLCYSGAAPAGQVLLDPVKVAGKVVVCTRGGNARVDKSAAVLNAGGVGMVLVDNGGGLVAEVHSVPTVHVTAADGAAIKAYAETPGSTAAISAFYIGTGPAPIMASFSSRGPNAGDANMLKPDLTAPGVDVIAAATPALSEAQRNAVAHGTFVPGPEWASYQGTSMSSPHVAGLAALLRQAHSTWSPAAIKSALMTTATTTLNDGQAGQANGLLPWAQGAGHVVPNKAIDPGLVYDAGPTDFIRYQCKVNKPAVSPASDCTTVGTLDETYNYNLPSITVGAVTGSTTVTRKVTNVGVASATYTPSFTAPTGFTMVVSPASLTLAPGAIGTFTVTLTANGAVDNVWGFGSLTWTDGAHVVRIPVTSRAGKAITAPALLTGTTTSGTRLITVKTGFAGRMSANKGGMKNVTMGPQAALTPDALSSAGLKTACINGADLPNVKVYPVNIPAGTIVARFALRDADVGTAGDDNDLLLLAPDNTSVYSGNDGSNELVQMVSPAAGSYKVCVVAYGGAASMTHKLSSWVVTTADASSTLNVMLPSQVYAGGTATVGVAWSGLATGQRYLGGFQLKDAGGLVQATTVVQVDTGAAAPLAQPSAVSTKVK